MTVVQRDACRGCNSETITPIINLGPAPLANQYKTRHDIDRGESYYPLELYRCIECGLVQLRDIVPGETLFREYDYVAGETSETLPAHFTAYAEHVMQDIDEPAPFIVGIGSNDGTFLRALQERGATVLGVDPAENVARIAEERGVPTLPRFFIPAVAEEIVASHGHADVVVANNVLGHVDDLHEVVAGITTLLADDGSLFFEVQYLPDLLQKNAFDMVYHEHRSYFSVKPLQSVLHQHGLQIRNIMRTSTQGGSIRVKATSGDQIGETADRMIAEEETLYQPAPYQDFCQRVLHVRYQLSDIIARLRQQDATIAGYGAPAKAAILLNYCNLGVADIAFAVDEIPAKQGKYIPGTRIPIRTPAAFQANSVDYGLLLAWNFQEEIIQKEQGFLEEGGVFIAPLPEPRLLSLEDGVITEQHPDVLVER